MSIWSNVVSQFRRPHGLVGRLAGWIMAHRPSNVERNRWTVKLLQLTPDARVLELGFGPGVGLAYALAEIPSGAAVGIDHSKTMVDQASRRNADALADGRLRLHVGTLEQWAADLGEFDAIYSCNVVQFWDEPVVTFRRLRSLLRPGGVVATTYLPRHPGARPEDAREMAERIAGWLERAGFQSVRRETLELSPVPAVCVIGR